MPPRKAQRKKGVRVVKQTTKCPLPQENLSSDKEEDFGTIRALVARVEALEKERRQPLDAEAGTSTTPAGKKSARLASKKPKNRILADLVSRIGVLEAAVPSEEPAIRTHTACLPADQAPISAVTPSVLSAAGHMRSQQPVPHDAAALTPMVSGFAAPSVIASPSAYTGLTNIPIPVRIVLCGHSIVFWAHRRASSSVYGTQLQLSATATIQWETRRGMLWDALLPAVCRIMSLADRPHILLIHLGENDLVQHPGLDLLLKVTRDLTWLIRSYPHLLRVWSEMLVRRVWRGAVHPNKIDRARKWVNRKVRDFVLSLGGAVLSHDRIRFHAPHLFRDDGVHLSEQGCDLFLEDLMGGLRGLLSSLGGGDQA
ncbi:uncharacterized protein LOC133384300 [Rhineura floridana]|uniref:uncharacterized protein LOC133384300 n=1 Tax=Rhineura floridana TaxID=261503 RepID=UPI002AC7FA4F|nr:uncharacterized protein LOC133384300 [Rhineura floridana]